MPGEVIGPREEPTSVVLLNEHVVKLPSKDSRLRAQISSLGFGQKHLLLQWTMINTETDNWPSAENK